MAWPITSKLAAISALAVAIGVSAANAQSSTGQITVLYDAFGKSTVMTKDWGLRPSWNMAASEFYSTPAIMLKFSRTTSKPRVST